MVAPRTSPLAAIFRRSLALLILPDWSLPNGSDQSPSTKSLGTSYTPHCTDLGCSFIRHPLGVIADKSRLIGDSASSI